MDEYRHHVSGFFPDRDAAERALSALAARELPRARLHIFDSQTAFPVAVPKESEQAESKEVLVDGAIGASVGSGLGALAGVALVAANVSLFVAAPLIVPLVILGWGVSLGGFLGAAVGVGNKEGSFADLVRDAIASGQVVLLVETRTELETSIAKEVIQASVGESRDVSTP